MLSIPALAKIVYLVNILQVHPHPILGNQRSSFLRVGACLYFSADKMTIIPFVTSVQQLFILLSIRFPEET